MASALAARSVANTCIAVMDDAILSGIMQRRQGALAHEEANTIDEQSLKAISK